MDKQQFAKPFRFVTNYGAPHPKRRRIGAACLTCRKRKTACSGERPNCDTCKQNRLECAGYAAEAVVEAAPKKRQHAVSADIDPALRQETMSMTGHASMLDKASPQASTSDVQPRASLFSGPRNRMPYFRWLGPTAIMPGFKQMVVKVKRQETTDANTSSVDGGAVLSPPLHKNGPALRSAGQLSADTEMKQSSDLPFYDTSPLPPSELITHLVQTFFAHLGCNFPFLQRDRFLRDLDSKQVDAILVDAVCSMAARFSSHPLVAQSSGDDTQGMPAEYGHAFAQRAKAALTETFACPTVAAVQAALLLAYNEFGESRDSGLWMYLGIAIRLAQDLGMHTIEGLRYKGMTGPTPRMLKTQSGTRSARPSADTTPAATDEEVEEQKAVEQERVDTFWAIFFLDRVVSSGTGRRSTLRDKDIELSFPLLSEIDPNTGWPAPFPALIRIVHLYGRVADLLNSIKEHSDITTDVVKRLGAMESQVTHLYQGLSTRLHFDAVNFQQYVKAGEGTNFVLLHFWFHTLIVLLHQPTLLKTFEGKTMRLFPNSQQLSISSAKTIADILSYSQLIDAKVCLGNPFTTQPIYIAACAFLRETEEHTSSNSQSRAVSPQPGDAERGEGMPHSYKSAAAKHTLLATAATQHYGLCYKALKSIETYWFGTKYILTVLDQKSEGVDSPLLYTIEEGESALEKPSLDPSFKVPGWRRAQSFSSSSTTMPRVDFSSRFWEGLPPDRRGSTEAIGWTLTGVMDSPSTNLAWHYPSGKSNVPGTGQTDDSQQNRSTAHYTITSSDVSDASLLLQLGTPFAQPPGANTRPEPGAVQHADPGAEGSAVVSSTTSDASPYGSMMIEQQDVATSMLGLDMMPWFDPMYAIEGDMLGLYQQGQSTSSGA